MKTYVAICIFLLAYLARISESKPTIEQYYKKATRSKKSNCGSEEVDFGSLGCFAKECFGYCSEPTSPEEIETSFILYTRNSRESGESFQPAHISTRIKSSNFDASKPTKVITHGYKSKASAKWIIDMKNALLDVEDVNVFCVDWEKGAWFTMDYPQARRNTAVVGKQLSVMIQDVSAATQAPLPSFHLIGHSLGAHISGIAGHHSKVGRISGLDPAGVSYGSVDKTLMLSPEDADFVDVIHSNLGTFGTIKPLGHVDFYPQGGDSQSDCWSPVCNHGQSHEFFTASINPHHKFPAYPCVDPEGKPAAQDDFLAGKCFPCQDGEDCSHPPSMGYYADKFPNRGVYMLLVPRKDFPVDYSNPIYGKYHIGSNLQNDSSIPAEWKEDVMEVIEIEGLLDESSSGNYDLERPYSESLEKLIALPWMLADSTRLSFKCSIEHFPDEPRPTPCNFNKFSIMDITGSIKSFCPTAPGTSSTLEVQLKDGDCTAA